MSKSFAVLLAVGVIAFASTHATAGVITEDFLDVGAALWVPGTAGTTGTSPGVTGTRTYSATSGSTITFDVTLTSAPADGNLANVAGFLTNINDINWFDGPLTVEASNFVVTGIPAGESLVDDSIKFGLTESFIDTHLTPTGTFESDGTTQFNLPFGGDADYTLDTGLSALIGGNSGNYTAEFDLINNFARFTNFDFSVEYETAVPTPEPTSLLLAAFGLIGLTSRRRRRARA